MFNVHCYVFNEKYYVRDVGVGRSSRLIPTKAKGKEGRMALSQMSPHPDKLKPIKDRLSRVVLLFS